MVTYSELLKQGVTRDQALEMILEQIRNAPADGPITITPGRPALTIPSYNDLIKMGYKPAEAKEILRALAEHEPPPPSLVVAPRPEVRPFAPPAERVVKGFGESPFLPRSTAEFARRLEGMDKNDRIRFEFNGQIGWVTKEIPMLMEPATKRWTVLPAVYHATEAAMEVRQIPERRIRRRFDEPVVGGKLITPGPPTWLYEFIEPAREERGVVKPAKRTSAYEAARVVMNLKPKNFVQLRARY